MRNSSLLGVIQLDQIQQQRDGLNTFLYISIVQCSHYTNIPLLLCWGANDQTFVYYCNIIYIIK